MRLHDDAAAVCKLDPGNGPDAHLVEHRGGRRRAQLGTAERHELPLDCLGLVAAEDLILDERARPVAVLGGDQLGDRHFNPRKNSS